MSEHEPFGFADGDFGHDAGHTDDPFGGGLADHGLADDHGLSDEHWTHDALEDGHDSPDHLEHSAAEGHTADDPHTADELPESLAGEHTEVAPVEEAYPPHLDVAISPTDGQEWVDPGLLGGEIDHEPVAHLAPPAELLDSLHAADGGDGEPSWDAAHNSADPAVRSLAAFWHPTS